MKVSRLLPLTALLIFCLAPAVHAIPYDYTIMTPSRFIGEDLSGSLRYDTDTAVLGGYALTFTTSTLSLTWTNPPTNIILNDPSSIVSFDDIVIGASSAIYKLHFVFCANTSPAAGCLALWVGDVTDVSDPGHPIEIGAVSGICCRTVAVSEPSTLLLLAIALTGMAGTAPRARR